MRVFRVFLLVALLFPRLVHAQLNRSAVSVTGLDTNTCTVTAPCRSFAQAITQTNVGGEVVALDSGGYGSFVVFKSLVVEAAPGVYAGVTVTSGDAVSVISGSSATLRNLVLNGLGVARHGVFNDGGTQVHIENCTIQNFSSFGVNAFGDFTVSDSTFRNLNTAMWIDNAGALVKVTIVNTAMTDNEAGIAAIRNARVTVRNSVATHNSVAFEALAVTNGGGSPGVLNLENCVASDNNFGVIASLGATVRLSNNLITANSTGVQNGQSTVETWGNNDIRGNTTNTTGTLTLISQQ